MVAGMFVGAAVTRYNDRRTANPSSSRQSCDRSGSRTSSPQDVAAGTSARAPTLPRPTVPGGSSRPGAGTDPAAAPTVDDAGSGRILETPGSPPIPSASDASPGALTREGLEARLEELFSVGYLTLTAIIQGAAFGLLFLSVQPQLASFTWSAHTATVLVQAFATAMAIVIVTQEYLLLTQIARWTSTIFDTLIPYLLGFGEIWMALATGHSTSWWIALCSLCGGAVLAFSYTANRRSEPVPGWTIEIQDQLKGQS